MAKWLKDEWSDDVGLREYMRFGDCWERIGEGREPFYRRRMVTRDMHMGMPKG